MDQRPEPGSIWTYKDVRYRVVRTDGLRMKDPSDANWHDAIEYQLEDGPHEFDFVRRLDDFTAKFEPVE